MLTQCVEIDKVYYNPLKHPENFDGNTVTAVAGLKKAGLIDSNGNPLVSSQDILAWALQNEFNPGQLNTPNATQVYATIQAMTRKFGQFCKAGLLSGSCVGWFLGYFSGVIDGTGKPAQKQANDLATAIMTPGDTTFNGMTIQGSWKSDGCSTGGYCHWANVNPVHQDNLFAAVIADGGQPDNGGLTNISPATPPYIHATSIFPTGYGGYYVVLNDADWETYCNSGGLCYP